MSTPLGTTTLTVTKEERTWRVECFCENGTDYTMVAHREILSHAADGSVVSSERGKMVTRSVSQVAKETDSMQMLGLVKAVCDRWAAEDAAAPPAIPVMPPGPLPA